MPADAALARRTLLAVMWRTYCAALNPAHGFVGSMHRDPAALAHALRRRRAGGVRTWGGSL